KLARAPNGLLTGREPIQISHVWKGHGFEGGVEASFVDGSFEVLGTLKFAYPATTPRLRGQVNVLVTTVERAWEAASRHDPAPMITHGMAPSGRGGGWAMTGWGTLDLTITKNLVASATFLVDPDGYVTAKGTLRMP